MRDDEEVDHEIEDFELVFIDQGELDNAQIFIVLAGLQIEVEGKE